VIVGPVEGGIKTPDDALRTTPAYRRWCPASQAMEAVMDAPATRNLNPARTVALALIALLVGGLVVLRVDRDPGLLAVPDGATAGDLALESCEYSGPSGSYPADCGTLVVAENPADPGSRLIALPVTVSAP
jgi:hypothetical protein